MAVHSASPAFVALLDRGMDAHRAGRPAEAATAYEQAIAAGAEAPGHDLLGAAFLDLGRTIEAAREFRRAIAFDPSRASSLGHHGNALKASGWPAEATTAYRRALAVAGPDGLWLRNLGLAALSSSRPRDAATLFHQILVRQPHDAGAHNDVGLALTALDEPGRAGRHFRLAAVLEPALPEALINLALVDLADRVPPRAATRARRGLACSPLSPDAMNALAAALLASDDPAPALPWLARALCLKPDMAEAHYNQGLFRMEQGALPAAESATRRALATRASYPEARWNLALIRLLAGDFIHGWRDYEARWQMREFPSPARDFAQPLWNGEGLGGRRILLHAEQGLGDTLQFIRYAPLVAGRGGRVVIECQPSLRRLIRHMDSVDDVRSQGEPLPAFDVHAPLLSLPRIFGTTVGTIPGRTPYLNLPSQAGPRRPPAEGLIGFAWAGSSAHRRDRARSLPPAVARAIAGQLETIGDVRIASLQLGERAREMDDMIPPALAPGGDFLDTAIKLTGMRLIVSVDTAIVHLAGALGLPAVVLLSFVPDFRWLLSGATTPWYPTLRLVRQARPGDWLSTIPILKKTVAELLGM